jgi:catechol 2,3-dioxygenase-like lactoylglutathione lyase family enzyme
MKVTSLDHLVLTVKNINKTLAFYELVLGMSREKIGDCRTALKFGNQKINLHEYGNEFEPKAFTAMPGAADLCFITASPLDAALEHVSNHGVDIIAGPVTRTGATGTLISFYFRDPDNNLIEVANVQDDA